MHNFKKPGNRPGRVPGLLFILLSIFLLFGCPIGGPGETVDITAPVPGGNGVVTITTAAGNSITLSWTPATDNTAAADALSYRLYYSTSEEELAAMTLDDPAGTAAGEWMTGASTLTVSGLSADTTYYFIILIKDTNDNIGRYQDHLRPHQPE